MAMSFSLAILASPLIVGAGLALALYRFSRWHDPAVDEELARIDLEADDRDSFARQLEQIRSLPSLTFDPERLGSS